MKSGMLAAEALYAELTKGEAPLPPLEEDLEAATIEVSESWTRLRI
jgi:flavin-dependent dehydrogenase